MARTRDARAAKSLPPRGSLLKSGANMNEFENKRGSAEHVPGGMALKDRLGVAAARREKRASAPGDKARTRTALALARMPSQRRRQQKRPLPAQAAPWQRRMRCRSRHFAHALRGIRCIEPEGWFDGAKQLGELAESSYHQYESKHYQLYREVPRVQNGGCECECGGAEHEGAAG